MVFLTAEMNCYLWLTCDIQINSTRSEKFHSASPRENFSHFTHAINLEYQFSISNTTVFHISNTTVFHAVISLYMVYGMFYCWHYLCRCLCRH